MAVDVVLNVRIALKKLAEAETEIEVANLSAKLESSDSGTISLIYTLLYLLRLHSFLGKVTSNLRSTS